MVNKLVRLLRRGDRRLGLTQKVAVEKVNRYQE